MKLICHVALASVAILLGLMLIHASEGPVSAYPENLFTTGGSGPRGRWASWSNPQPENQKFEGNRWHFGVPCWALYLDVDIRSGAWYAALDLVKLCVNVLVALPLGVIVVLFVHRLKAQPVDEPNARIRSRR